MQAPHTVSLAVKSKTSQHYYYHTMPMAFVLTPQSTVIENCVLSCCHASELTWTLTCTAAAPYVSGSVLLRTYKEGVLSAVSPISDLLRHVLQ